MKSWLFGLIALLLALPAQAQSTLNILENDMFIGQPSAPVQIFEYASMSCPHCASFHNNVLPTLKEKYINAGKVVLIHRHFPHNEPALKAAMVTRCVPKEQYFTFVDVFFELQDQWAFTTDFLSKIISIAKVGGLAPDHVSACMTNVDLEKEILLARKEAGETLPIDGIPFFFINGQPYEGPRTVEGFSQAIDSHLNRNNP